MNGYLHRSVRGQPQEYALTVEPGKHKSWGIVWTHDPDARKIVDDGTASRVLNWITGQVAKRQYIGGAYGFTPITGTRPFR